MAIETTDPELRAAVERMLPGSTGPGQRGWFAKLQEFVSARARETAQSEGKDVAAAEAAVRFPAANDITRQLRDDIEREGQDAITPQVAQRLAYVGLGIGALDALSRTLSTSVPVLESIDIEAFTTLFTTVAPPTLFAEQSADIRSDESGSGSGADQPEGAADAQPGADANDDGAAPETPLQPLELLTTRGADGWGELMAHLANTRADGSGPEAAFVAAVPLKARGESLGAPVTHLVEEDGTSRSVTDQEKLTSDVIQIGEDLCVLLTTEFTRTPYEIGQVLSKIDPQNWDNANKFFAKMTPKPLATDGRSSQILEEVSTHPDIYRIKTNLKYVKEDRSDDTFVINYDFAADRGSDDSNQVKVDSGYILVGPSDDGNGVRVLTSKMVAIDGLSPTAVAVFAHAMGWLSIGQMMMFGTPADTAGDPLIAWTPSADRSALIPTPNRNALATGPVGREEIQPVSQLFVREATNAVVDYVKIATSETAAVADKWLTGQLSVADMAERTQKLGGKLASEPFRLLERMMKNAVGPASSQSSADRARGGDST
ncbi:hypothetical protein DVS77_23305 [Mycolicibacterium moriokaense]|nr:hypothetical protein DVS77_23305 [Mycolicibacterium moriokaense]